MRILILNWRDPQNPLAGGAEVLTEALATRWVARGHSVTWYSSGFPGAARQEQRHGIRFIRAGGRWTVYWRAYRYYQRQGRDQHDVIFDEINTVPFFSPWYARQPTVLHFNQLAREVWFYECAPIVAAIGYGLEPLGLRPYRACDVIAVSNSGRQDLIRLGFSPEKITVIPMGGVPAPALSPVARDTIPTVLFVGRLKRSKRVDHVIRALALLPDLAQVRLWIVGNGDASYRRALEQLAQRLGVASRVEFFGFVAEEEKHRLMQRAHVLAVPSVREGWGLVVSEANHWGTPAVVYPVPGLVDSTKDGITGLVCRDCLPEALADALRRLLTDQPLWARLSGQVKRSITGDEPDRAADLVLAVLTRAVEARKGQAPSWS